MKHAHRSINSFFFKRNQNMYVEVFTALAHTWHCLHASFEVGGHKPLLARECQSTIWYICLEHRNERQGNIEVFLFYFTSPQVP